MPCSFLYGKGDAEECADVRDGTIQTLKIYVQRPALRTPRLFVQTDSLHVKAFEDSVIENLSRIVDILSLHRQLDSTDEIRDEPVEPDQVFITQKTFNARRFQTSPGQQRLRKIAEMTDRHKLSQFDFFSRRSIFLGPLQMPPVKFVLQSIPSHLRQRVRMPRQTLQLAVSLSRIIFCEPPAFVLLLEIRHRLRILRPDQPLNSFQAKPASVPERKVFQRGFAFGRFICVHLRNLRPQRGTACKRGLVEGASMMPLR